MWERCVKQWNQHEQRQGGKTQFNKLDHHKTTYICLFPSIPTIADRVKYLF